MCHLMLRRQGIPHPSKDERVRYQADRLGRRDGDTLLTELLPYPHSDSGQWLYSNISRFSTRESYTREMLPARLDHLRAVLSGGQAKLVVAYGKSHWDAFRELAPGAVWKSVGPYDISKDGERTFLLAPHFSTAAFNTDVDLDVFADVALGERRSAERSGEST